MPDYLKFKGHKPKPKKKKSEDKSFVTYQKKTNPYFQTKKSNKKKNLKPFNNCRFYPLIRIQLSFTVGLNLIYLIYTVLHIFVLVRKLGFIKTIC